MYVGRQSAGLNSNCLFSKNDAPVMHTVAFVSVQPICYSFGSVPPHELVVVLPRPRIRGSLSSLSSESIISNVSFSHFPNIYLRVSYLAPTKFVLPCPSKVLVLHRMQVFLVVTFVSVYKPIADNSTGCEMFRIIRRFHQLHINKYLPENKTHICERRIVCRLPCSQSLKIILHTPPQGPIISNSNVLSKQEKAASGIK